MGYIVSVVALILIGTAAYFVSRFLRQPLIKSVAAGFVLVALPVVTLLNMVNQIPAGHVGIVYTFRGITGQVGDGLQWVAPWRSVLNATIQVQGHKFEQLTSFSNETQDVTVAATINVQVSPNKIQELYREVGPNYFDVLIRPRVMQAFKDETVKYASVQIAPNREAIRRAVRERLTKELETHSIAVQDLLVDNIVFSRGFQEAIEEKQRQTQLALAEKEKVASETSKADQAIEQARGTAEAVLINAKKQAEANRALAASITPEYIQYMTVTKLAPNVEVIMVPTGQQFIMGADMLKKQPPQK